jgi:hypothetical protein
VASPLVISGKPFFSYQAYLPVTFALAVIMAALTSLIGMLALNKLPRWNHPLFASRLFSKLGDNGFFITIESSDPGFSDEETPAFLRAAGAGEIEILRGK